MTQLKPIDNLFAIEVPEGAKNFGCVHVFQGEDILYFPNEKEETVPIANAPCHCDLVEILFTTKNCTEQQAAGVVAQQRGGGKFKDYECAGSYAKYGTYLMWTAIGSLQSLLRANGLDKNKNYLLIKKQETIKNRKHE